MESEKEYSNNAFIEVAMNKMEKQDERMANIEALIKKQTDNTEINKLVAAIESLKEKACNTGISGKNIFSLNMQMEKLISQLNTIPDHKVLHHHHVPKIIWATAGLMIALCIVCIGWFYTSKKLDGFIASDTKYRALRLDTSHKFFQQYLDFVDSVYIINPDMRNVILQKEEEYEMNFKRMQKALELKEEAEKLEKAEVKK